MLETTQQTLTRNDDGSEFPPDADIALVVCAAGQLRTVPLRADSEVVIGRHESCQVSLAIPTLSRYHARFTRFGRTVTVEDLGSRHGTRVYGEWIRKAKLGPGTAVQLGGVVVAVDTCSTVIESPGSESAPPLVPEALYLSARMREIQSLLHRVARTDLSVVLFGETGTGKELAVRELHEASSRRNKPLQAISCASIPRHLIETTLFGHERGAFTGADRPRAGIFEEAAGGTVFLDEVGELSPPAQAALLRVLETRKLTRVGSSREIAIDVRVVAATHRDLDAMVRRGEFRSDLLHRLCVVSIELPPLRARREEIAPLARHFLGLERIAKEIDPRALSRLEEYDWPGNIRELRNVIARAAVLCRGPCITAADLTMGITTSFSTEENGAASRQRIVMEPISSGNPLRSQLQELERAEMERALAETQGNRRRAAALLGVPLRTFERRLQAWRMSGRHHRQ